MSKLSTLQWKEYLPYLLWVAIADMEVGKEDSETAGKRSNSFQHFPTYAVSTGLVGATCQEASVNTK